MRRIWIPGVAALLFAVPPLEAQQHDEGSELGTQCREIGEGSPHEREARRVCFAVAQAAHSAQPQLGMLIAGGNPTLGTANTRGFRFGTVPGFSASARVNAVFVRIPNVLAEQAGEEVQRYNEAAGIPLPAVGGDVALGIFPGFDLVPGFGGVGSLDVMGSATWLPFNLVDTEGITEENPSFAYGIGGRVGILRESLAAPAISVSLMRRSLGRAQFGNVCPGGADDTDGELRPCTGDGDAGEFAFDLINWSGRAAVSKRFLGLGATAGVGYDRYESGIDFGYRVDGTLPVIEEDQYARQTDLTLAEERWSVFGNLSYTLLVGTLALEGGWLEGMEPIQGFDEQDGGFDPTRGSWFASLGLRVAF